MGKLNEMKPRKEFTTECKLTAIRRLQSWQSTAEVARGTGSASADLYRLAA